MTIRRGAAFGGRRGPFGSVGAALLLAAVLALGTWGQGPGALAAGGDEEVFVPPTPETTVPPVVPKPDPPPPPVTPKRDSVPGTWDIVEKGSITCAGSGTVKITAKGGGYGGFMSWSLTEGPTSVSVRAGKIRMAYEYVDLFGDKAKSIYDGTLSADRLSASGTVTGEWDEGCTFTMQHR